MASTRQDDVFSQGLQYERPKKDKIFNACLAAFCSSLATVNFGYALGFTAEAELSGAFKHFSEQSSSSGPSPSPSQLPSGPIQCNKFDIFASVVALGALIGGVLGGYLIDKIGRKSTIILTTLFYTPGWLLITFSARYRQDKISRRIFPTNSYSDEVTTFMLYFGRMLTGVGVGLSSLAVPVYISEVAPARMRGALGNINQLSTNLGFLLAYIAGFDNDLPVTSLVPIGISLLHILMMVCFLPETPRWLLANNQRHDAILALYWLRGANYMVEEECFEIESAVNFGYQDRLEIKDLKKSTFYRPLIIALCLMFFQQFCGINCILFYCSRIFQRAGIGRNIDMSSFSTFEEVLKVIENNAKTNALYVSLTLFIFTAISCVLVDRVGRRKLLLTGSITMVLALFCIGLYCKLQPDPQIKVPGTSPGGFSIVALVCTLLFIAMFSIGWGPLPWLLMSELFPLKTRAIATGIVTSVNWLFVFITTATFCYMLKYMEVYGSFWFFSAITTLGFFFTLFFVPETKGRPLEDVSEMFFEKRVLQVNLPWQRRVSL